MKYINKQNNNYKINNFNYLTKNNLKQNDVINNIEKIIDTYMVKFIYNDILEDNKLQINNNNNIVLKEDTINLNKRNTLYNTRYNIVDNNIEIIMFIYEKSAKNKLLYSYLTNLKLKKRFFRNKNRKTDISLDLLIKHNQKSLYYICNSSIDNKLDINQSDKGLINNSNYSNLEDYLNNILSDYNITIKPIILKYPQMDNKIFNNFIMFRQTKNEKII